MQSSTCYVYRVHAKTLRTKKTKKKQDITVQVTEYENSFVPVVSALGMLGHTHTRTHKLRQKYYLANVKIKY